jgi:hypothetical protein
LIESSQPHILEIKSANAKSFKQFKDKGVKEHSPRYYGQVQCYMHYAGLKRAIFIIENKDSSELLQERIHYNESDFQMLREKAADIIEAKVAPRGISVRADFFICKFCSWNERCHNG